MKATFKKVLSASLLLLMLGSVAAGSAYGYGGSFDPVAHVQMMKATIQAFPGSSKDEKNLLKRMDNILKLLAKGDKNEKAEDKMKRVVSDMQKRLTKKKDFKKLSDAEAQAVLNLAQEFVDKL